MFTLNKASVLLSRKSFLYLVGVFVISEYCFNKESIAINRPERFNRLYYIQVKEDKVTLIELPSEQARVMQFRSDSELIAVGNNSIQIREGYNWNTLPEMKGNITDSTLLDSTILAADDQGTILSLTENQTDTFSTNINAPHFFSLNKVVAVTKEFFLVFNTEGSQVEKYPNPVNLPFSLYKNNPDYAVLSYEEHLLVWDHVFKESHYLKLSAPLTIKV